MNRNIDTLDGQTLDDLISVLEGSPDAWRGGFTPSTRWHDGGPIIEREKIDLCAFTEDEWSAGMFVGNREDGCVVTASAPTPLIAAMRCYAKSKMGQS